MEEGLNILMDSLSGERTAARMKVDFEEAFSLYHRTVFRAAFSIVREQSLAEEVVQETFIKLYGKINDFPDFDLLKPWLIRVALNLSKNSLRSISRTNRREENYVKEAEGDAVFNVETELERKREIEEVRRAVDKIREPNRTCLMLKQQGLSYAEIADSLNLNMNSVGQMIARARKEFLRYYGKIGGGA